jgi:hypothetical protein
MSEELTFVADAALIDRLGRELVGRQETALIELVKNSYDADATKVTVTLESSGTAGNLVVDDNGTGMTRQELLDGFLRLASGLKVSMPKSKLFGRHRAGRKGLGRFSAQRLGSTLSLRTWVDPALPGFQLLIDWSQFKMGRRLENIPVALSEVPPRHTGTRLEIGKLRDEWSDSQVRRCWRGLLNLQQPFPVAPVGEHPLADPGFKVEFWREGGLYSNSELVANLQTEILDHLHALIELRVDQDGRAEWRLSQNRFGPDRQWTRIHHQHREARDPPPYSALRTVWMKAYYFILLPSLLPSLVYTRLRDVLSDEGGIRLYRNGFRVIPYGDPGNDWLRLDEIYSKRSYLAPVANRNFFGVIEVHDPEGSQFEEHTSREGLIETPALAELRDLASSVLLTATTRISEDRGRKSRAGRTRAQASVTTAEDLREAASRAREAAGRVHNISGTISRR